MNQSETASSRIAIIAGNGVLPEQAWRELEKRGRSPLVIGILDEIDEAFSKNAAAVLSFGQLGKLFDLLAKEEISRVIFAGGIRKRPDFKRLKLDMVTVKELPSVLKIAMGGDNSVLGKIATYLEKRDLEVVGIHEVLPELLAEDGNIAGRLPIKIARETARLAFAAAKTIGKLDAGQGAVCEDGRVVALEGAEGTDAMIERVRDLRANGRLSRKPNASVLAKAMKPKQDMRADLPSIGPNTIRQMADAGIKGVVVEAGRSLILDRDKTLALASKAGVFIAGLHEGDGSS